MDSTVSKDIDILRGIAVLGVIAGHTLYTVIPVINGAFWVWIFFILSGYIQGISFSGQRYKLNKKGISAFYANRLLRIAPLFWLLLFISCITRIYFFNENLEVWHTVKQFFALTTDMTLVGPLWTIATELQFYLFVPIIALFLSKIKIYKNIFFILMLIGSVYFYNIWVEYFHDNGHAPRLLILNSAFFILGLFLSYLSYPKFRSNTVVKYSMIIIFVVIALYFDEKLDKYFWERGRVGMIIASIVSIICLSVSRTDDQNTKNITNLIYIFFRQCGRYCYGIYAYAALLSVFAIYYKFNVGYYGFLFQLLGIPLAIISFKYFESYFNTFKIYDGKSSSK